VEIVNIVAVTVDITQTLSEGSEYRASKLDANRMTVGGIPHTNVSVYISCCRFYVISRQ